jgi:NAD(P)-dependent dehydrogenase (short-subunit alcohol dehydrogenase family)
VIYLPKSEGDWIPPEEKWRQVRYEHGRVDFTHERNGASGDLDLRKLSIYVIVWSTSEARELARFRTLVKWGSGSVINNGSIAGHRTGYAPMLYGAAKAAVSHLTRCAAMELGEHNVRVNSVSPGAIATGIFAKAHGMTPQEADLVGEKMKAGTKKNPHDPAISRRRS